MQQGSKERHTSGIGSARVSNNLLQESVSAWLLCRMLFDTQRSAGLPAPQAFSPCTSRIHRMVCLPSPLCPPQNTPDDPRSAAMWHSQFEFGLSAYAHTEGDTATPPQAQSVRATRGPLQVLA